VGHTRTLAVDVRVALRLSSSTESPRTTPGKRTFAFVLALVRAGRIFSRLREDGLSLQFGGWTAYDFLVLANVQAHGRPHREDRKLLPPRAASSSSHARLEVYKFPFNDSFWKKARDFLPPAGRDQGDAPGGVLGAEPGSDAFPCSRWAPHVPHLSIICTMASLYDLVFYKYY